VNHVLHVSAASAKETDDGVVETITLTAVSINPAEMIPLVGEQVILTTPGRAGRKFGGSLTLLQLKDGKHGPEITVKVVGATELNSLVGTNVTVEAAQMELPNPGAVAPNSVVEVPHDVVRVVRPVGLGHLDPHIVDRCPACGPEAREAALVGAAPTALTFSRVDAEQAAENEKAFEKVQIRPLTPEEIKAAGAVLPVKESPMPAKETLKSLAADDLENF
jgi:hypothetical protein